MSIMIDTQSGAWRDRRDDFRRILPTAERTDSLFYTHLVLVRLSGSDPRWVWVWRHGNPSRPRAMKPVAQPGRPVCCSIEPEQSRGHESPDCARTGYDGCPVCRDRCVQARRLRSSVWVWFYRLTGRKPVSQRSRISCVARRSPLSPLRRRGAMKAWWSTA